MSWAKSFSAAGKKRRFWLSFRDPEIDKNLGVAIIVERSHKRAIQKAWRLGINPGGEVFSHVAEPSIPDEIRDRLLTADELALYGKRGVTLSPGMARCSCCGEDVCAS